MSGGDLADSPALYPLRLGGGRVGLVPMGEEDYRRASFLDERLLEAHGPLLWRAWPALPEPQDAPLKAHFVFHIGHCGSTLLSRLMGEHPAVFSVREPALLREVATGRLSAEAHTLLPLFARVWRPGQTALIKATSFVSALAPGLMTQAPQARAILLSTTPPNYLRSILGGPASRQEAQAFSPARRARLSQRLGFEVTVQGEGETIAMSWLCEALSLHDLVQAASGRCLWLDFDRLLSAPAAALRLGLAHLGADPAAVDIEGLVAGPLMRRYAKAPEHAYDSALRQRVLEQAGRQEAAEVRRGMDWLQRQHGAHPAVAPVLQRAALAARASLAQPEGPG